MTITGGTCTRIHQKSKRREERRKKKEEMTSNNAIIYKAPPPNGGYAIKGETLEFVKREFNLEQLKLDENEFVLENLYVSIDPYQRGRMTPKTAKSYAPPYQPGSEISNGGIGRVVKSNNKDYPVGALVTGHLDWAEYTVVPEALLNFPGANFKKVENKYNLPLSNWVGVLGMPGLTAYSSLYEIGKPQKDQVIFISAASGAVGQLVGQLAKLEGMYVVGSAGSDDKVAYLKDQLHFDAAFNYKKEKPSEALPKYCPKGIDIYYENVGGETLEAALDNMNLFSRIVVCGMISQYNTADKHGVRNLMQIVSKRITMQGFIVSDLRAKYEAEFFEKMQKYLADKKIVYKEDITDSLEAGVDAFIGIFTGENFGKLMIGIQGKNAK